jgi:hypothetical protein
MQTPRTTPLARVTSEAARNALRFWYWHDKPHSFGRRATTEIVEETYRLAGIPPYPFYMRNHN